VISLYTSNMHSTVGEAAYSVEQFNGSDDIPANIALMHLGIRRWQEANGQILFTDIRDSQADLTAISQYYIEPGGNFFVAKDAHAAVLGFVGIRRNCSDQGIIKRLAVAPEQQGRGIGHALVGTAINWAQNNGLTKLSLITGEGEQARPIYEKYGFCIVDFILPKKDKHLDWVMELDLE
jgi:GNAT superfamily N-acetyltransferase